MAKSKRRRQKQYEVVDTSFEMQEGSWVKVPKSITVANSRFFLSTIDAYQSATFLGDTEAHSTLQQQIEALNKRANDNERFIEIYKNELPKCLVDWNWATDIEAEIASVNDDEIVLENYLLADSVMPIDKQERLLSGDIRVYIGSYPNNYDTYIATFDGNRKLTVKQKLRRNYEPTVDYVVVGYPSPTGEKTFELLSDNEIVHLGTQVLSFYSSKFKQIQDDLEKKKVD